MAPCPIRRLDLKSEVKTSVAEDMEKLKKKKKLHILLVGKYSGTTGFAKQLGSSSNG